MKLEPFVQSLLTFLIRRGLSLLGTAGLAVTDDWIAQTVSVLMVLGNEVIQYIQAHKHGEKEAAPVKIST